MVILNSLTAYSDENGNQILFSGREVPGVRIEFTGSGNTLSIPSNIQFGKLNVVFDCDNGMLRMAGNQFGTFSGFIRIGQDSVVDIGKNVTTTNTCVISAVEGTSVVIGDDVMLASENEIRADDGHAIFDIETEKRLNTSKDIHIGNHVWIAKRAVLLGGANVGDGSVIGFGSILTGTVPNNCVAAGVPARVIRSNVAWERPHLSRSKPYYKPDASTVNKSSFWQKTQTPEVTKDQEVIVLSTAGEQYAVKFKSHAEADAWKAKYEKSRFVTIPLLQPTEAHDLITGKAPSTA